MQALLEVECDINSHRFFLLFYFVIVFVSHQLSVLSLCKVNLLKKVEDSHEQSFFAEIPGLCYLLHCGEAHWSHCVTRGAFMSCSMYWRMVTNSIRHQCKGMFWLEYSKCSPPHESSSRDLVSRESWVCRSVWLEHWCHCHCPLLCESCCHIQGINHELECIIITIRRRVLIITVMHLCTVS